MSEFIKNFDSNRQEVNILIIFDLQQYLIILIIAIINNDELRIEYSRNIRVDI